MKIILKHIFRNICEKKGRSLLIILSLIIATAVLVLNLTLPDEITLKTQETLRLVYGASDVAVKSEEAFSLNDVKLPQIEFDYVGLSAAEVYTQDSQLQIYGINVEDAKKMRLLGGDVPNLEKNEVIISKQQADDYSYKTGDKLTVTLKDKQYELVVTKIVSEIGLTALDADYPIFIANSETVTEMTTSEPGKYDAFYLDIVNDEEIKEFTKSIKDNNEKFIAEELIDAEAIKESLSFVTYIMILIFALATIMIFFVISSLNKIIIAERMPVIGTFRSIGATKNKMNCILILENAVYGLIGGIIGAILGYLINDTAASLFIVVRGTELSDETAQMSFIPVAIGVAFAVLLEVLISIKEIRKANKKNIKVIIFDVQSTRYNLKKTKTIVGFVLIVIALLVNYLNFKMILALTIISIVLLIVGVANIVPFVMRLMSKLLASISKKLGWATGIIASKNIGYNKMIISSSRLIVVSVSLILAILTVSNSFTELFSSFKYTVADHDIVIQYVTKPNEEYEPIKQLQNVENVDYMYCFFDNTTYNGGLKFDVNPTILGQAKSSKYIKEFDYKIEDLEYNEVLIDEKYAEKNNIKISDVLKIKFETSNKELEFKVVGFINSAYFTTSRNVILMNLQNFLDNITTVPYQVLIDAKDGADLEKLMPEIKDTIKELGVKIQTVEEYVTEQENQIASVMSLFYVIIGLAVILSFIGILNNQIIGFMQRRKELAVLNSTCMSKRQIKNMLFAETMLSNSISCILAICVGFITVGMIESFMQGLSLYVDIIFSWQTSLIFVSIVFITLLLTLIIPIRRINKMNVVNEIKYE